MKPMLAALLVTTLTATAFAIEVVPAVPPIPSFEPACTACREATCDAAHSSCASPQPTAAASSNASTCTAATCTAAANCSGACDHERQAELASTGLEPYRIGSPDVVSIRISLRKSTACSELDCQAAECDEHALDLPFANSDLPQVVEPDGRITIEGLGRIYVAGLTTGEAECEITKRILDRHPAARSAILAVSIEVPATNSKQAYVVLLDGSQGDCVWQVPVDKATTVGSALRQSALPQPICFASTRTWVARTPAAGGTSTELPVVWDAAKGQPTCESNHALLPGDRLYVDVTNAAPRSIPQTTQTSPGPLATIADFLQGVPAAHPCAVPSPVLAPQSGPLPAASPLALPAPPRIPKATHYAAVPTAGPTPYRPSASPLSAPYPALIAPQAYIPAAAPAAPPLPQPPQPLVAPDTVAPARGCDAKQVQFAIVVIQDVSGSFAEFSQLRDGPIMVSDSDAVLGTVRVLEKQQLAKRISAPRIMCAVDEQASLCVTTAAADGSAERAGGSLSVNVRANGTCGEGDGAGMQVETSVRATRDRHVHEVQLEYLVSEGQSAIIRCHHPSLRSKDADPEHPVYVVVTPTLVK